MTAPALIEANADPFAAMRALNRMRAAGFVLELDGPALTVSPADRLTDAQRAYIRTHKPALVALLQDAGATVVMTRTKNDVSVSNKERAEMMNDARVDFWIRIHCNSSTSKLTEGALVIAPSKQMTIGAQSEALGKALLDEFCAATGAINRSVIYSASQTGFNWSDSPVVTIEMGYLSNPQEDTKLCRASYQDACAAGIYNGIIKYMNGRDEQ